VHAPDAGWRRNVAAVAAASFIGFTGFTLVMPFLPLFIRQLGVADVGEIALWTGVALGVTPALNALVSPFWGRLADRFGRKIMIVRSLATCVLVMLAMAYVTRPWHVIALRAVLGLLTGYGGLAVTMAAESSPPAQVAASIGAVQTAQRLGPAFGPVIGGTLAGLVGLRGAFLVTAAFYAVSLATVVALYDEQAAHSRPTEPAAAGRVTFRNVLAFENFLVLMLAIFAVQFVDRSFGPVLPLYVERVGVDRDRVALAAGLLFSSAAFAGALGNHASAWMLRRRRARDVIAGAAVGIAAGSALVAQVSNVWTMGLATLVFGGGVGMALTAAYAAAARVIPAGAQGVGFGMLSSASLTGMAVSPVVAGMLGAASIRTVFLADAALMVGIALTVWKKMI
jgi:MFS family permease